MAVSALELVEDLQTRSGLDARVATAVVHTITRAAEDNTSQLLTRDQLDGRLAEIRAEIAGFWADLKGEVAGLRVEVKSEIASLRGELRTEIASLRGELRTEIAGLRADLTSEVAGLKVETASMDARMHSLIRAQTTWIAGVMIAVASVSIAIFRLLP